MAKSSAKESAVTSADWRQIKLLVLDVDGVLTDGTVFIGPDGFEFKQFSVLDGLGLACLKQVGVSLAVISGRMSEATISRTTELKFDHIVQGRKDKRRALEELANQIELEPEAICYVGDDAIDAPALEYAGIGVAVANGVPLALQSADWITERSGGQGAVREVCDRILESRNETVLSLSNSK